MKRKAPPPKPADVLEAEVQQRARIGITRDELLKREIRKHPEREIPKVEDVDPGELP